MKKTSSIYIYSMIYLICVFPQYMYSSVRVVPYIRQRPTQLAMEERLPEWYEYLLNHLKCGNGRLNITPVVTETFKAHLIAQSLFNLNVQCHNEDNVCERSFRVSGSQAPRMLDDWLADYFGLPTDYLSIIRLKPRITNVITDLNAQYNLDSLVYGLYIDIHAPFVFTSWDLHAQEYIICGGSQAYAPGYITDIEVPRSHLTPSFYGFVTNDQTPDISQVTFSPLEYAKFGCKPLAKKEFSLIDVNLGWLAYSCGRIDLAGELGFTAPLNTKPHGIYIFEPVTGNTGHWQLNGNIFAHIGIWASCDECQEVSIYAGLQLAHFFASKQHRTFDLCGKPNSRYMLAQQFTQNVQNQLRADVQGSLIQPSFQGLPIFSPVANLTTIPIDVSIALQIDCALALTYISQRTTWMFGYGYWGQTREKIIPLSCSKLNQYWSLKGDAQVIGFEDSPQNTPVALSATQSQARIERGSNSLPLGNITPESVALSQTNPRIDHPFAAFADADGDTNFLPLISQPSETNLINTSYEPIFICPQDLDIASAELSNSAHKLFSNVIYTWREQGHFMPYLGIGASVYFGQDPRVIASCTAVEEFHAVTISFWSLWIKAGCNF